MLTGWLIGAVVRACTDYCIIYFVYIYNTGVLTVWLTGAVVVFAIVFAVNSSIHSFLVVHYAKHDKATTTE